MSTWVLNVIQMRSTSVGAINGNYRIEEISKSTRIVNINRYARK